MSRWLAITTLLLLTLKAGAESSNLTTSFADRVSSSSIARLKNKSPKDSPNVSLRGAGAFKLGSLIDNILPKSKDVSNSNPVVHVGRDVHSKYNRFYQLSENVFF